MSKYLSTTSRGDIHTCHSPKPTESVGPFDFPVVILLGGVAGLLIVGVFQATLGGVFDKHDGTAFAWGTIIGGIVCITLAAMLSILTVIYASLVPLRYKIIAPKMIGFSLIFGILSAFSMAMMGSELCLWVENVINSLI